MGIVQEVIDKFLFDEAPRVVRRQEELLLADPLPGPVKLWQDQSPLEAVHFPQAYRPQKFAPPRGVYESDHIRIEWQTMDDSRQPFYHRNCDADELSCQIWGERTLMTELGSLEHVPRDFSRIPVGVAFASVSSEQSAHITLVSAHAVPQVAAASKKAERVAVEEIDSLRRG